MKDKEKDEESKGKDGESMVEGVVEEFLPGISGLVKKLKKVSPEFEKRIEEAEKEIKDRLEKGYSPEPKIGRGFTVRPIVREEERKERVAKKAEKKTIEPLVDIFDEKNYIRMIVELPGVSEENIRVEVEKRRIILDARSEEKRYHKTIELPCDVKDIKKRYKNGILELEAVKSGT